MWRQLLITILWAGIAPATMAAEVTANGDLEREKRLASEAEAGIFIGEPLYLEADGHEFLAIYAEAETDEASGAALVLHGRGLHPNWPEVTAPLRSGLAENGWHTLSIQLPVLHKQAKYYDYLPLFPAALQRIKTAVEYLQEQGSEKIILVAHSCGVHMSMAYIDEFGADEFSAYIGVGMGATDAGQEIQNPFPLEQLSIPLLDVYGANDYPTVMRTAAERAEILQNSKNPHTRQLVIEGADHYFKDDGVVDDLLEQILGWLQQIDTK